MGSVPYSLCSCGGTIGLRLEGCHEPPVVLSTHSWYPAILPQGERKAVWEGRRVLEPAVSV